MDVLARNHVQLSGPEAGQPIMFAHGFGCDQAMWRFVTPAFVDRHRVVLFDHVGCGHSDDRAYEPAKYDSLDGYARDVLEIIDELDLREVIFVGHSVASMIGILAVNARPDRFAALVLIGPSPRYIDDGDYIGGFAEEEIDDLLESLDSNYLGWSKSMAPVIMANAERPELADELSASFCRVDPAIARQFARVTFLADNRADLARIGLPTLVLQCADDVIAPSPVGHYVHRSIAGSELEVLDVSGHCPNLSAPDITVAAIRRFVERQPISS